MRTTIPPPFNRDNKSIRACHATHQKQELIELTKWRCCISSLLCREEEETRRNDNEKSTIWIFGFWLRRPFQDDFPTWKHHVGRTSTGDIGSWFPSGRSPSNSIQEIKIRFRVRLPRVDRSHEPTYFSNIKQNIKFHSWIAPPPKRAPTEEESSETTKVDETIHHEQQKVTSDSPLAAGAVSIANVPFCGGLYGFVLLYTPKEEPSLYFKDTLRMENTIS
jgi:hypothetical protein